MLGVIREHILTLKFGARICNTGLDSLLGGFKELLLLQLHYGKS